MKLSYRARRTWHRVGIAALAIAVLAALMIFVWTVWLGRYVVYTRNGATLDFNSSAEMIDGVVAQEPPTQETVSVVYNEGEDAIDTGSEMTQLNGFFISAFDLTDDLATVQELADSIPNGSSVMIDVRSSYGYAYYSSTVAPTADSVNVAAVDALIASLKARNVYLIARLPAFQNYYYGLNNVPAGLAVDAGYLWMDDEGCYWAGPGFQLGPESAGADRQRIEVPGLPGSGVQSVLLPLGYVFHRLQCRGPAGGADAGRQPAWSPPAPVPPSPYPSRRRWGPDHSGGPAAVSMWPMSPP